MEKEYRVSFNLTADANAEDSLKNLEHHAERLLDLDSWPEIKTVYGLKVEEKTNGDNGKISAERIKEILVSYIDNDLESAEPGYVRDVLQELCSKDELKSLGLFDWLGFGNDDEEDD